MDSVFDHYPKFFVKPPVLQVEHTDDTIATILEVVMLSNSASKTNPCIHCISIEYRWCTAATIHIL